MSGDRRSNPRFEPRAVQTVLSLTGYSGVNRIINGMILDASEKGLAMETYEEVTEKPQQGNTVSLKIKNTLLGIDSLDIGEASVERTWSHNEAFGLALNFQQPIQENAKNLLLNGPRQDIRVKNQSELAVLDIGRVHAHVQALHNCQLKLLAIALTAGLGLGGAYLTLCYHSATLSAESTNIGGISFWRMWVAILPGLLAIAIASMVTQKIASIARNEAFLSILGSSPKSGGDHNM